MEKKINEIKTKKYSFHLVFDTIKGKVKEMKKKKKKFIFVCFFLFLFLPKFSLFG